MDRDELGKMTVAQLREEAKKLPDAKGLSSMKKDDLIDLLMGAGGEDVSKKVAAAGSKTPSTSRPQTKSELKQRIRELKEMKREALARNDRQKARECNREIHHCKHRLRRMLRETQAAT